MRVRRSMVPAVFLVIVVLAGTPSGANDDAVGFTLDRSSMSFASLSDDFEFSGFTGFVKIGADDRWGVVLAYRTVEDEEDLLPGEEISYTQAGVYVTRLWRTDAIFRPLVKFGLIWIDFTLEATGFPLLGETTTGLAAGGGFELGSQRVALLVEYERGFVEIFNDDVDLGDLSVGVVFKY